MARQQEFDTEVALERAKQVFWTRGYAETSISDLVEETGVARAGLYKVFVDKEGLFQAALSKYVSENVDTMFEGLKRPNADVDDIKAVFARVVTLAKSGRFRRGCFLVNTMQEVRGGDGVTEKIIQKTLKFQTSCFRRALERSLSAGKVRRTLLPSETADALLVSFYGMAALARAGASWRTLDHAADAAIKALQ